MHTVYALTDPRTGAVRYIGVTKSRLCKRRADHIHDARRHGNYRVCNWIRSLLSEAVRPEIHPIETVLPENRQSRERHWIAFYRALGADLTNTTSGGEGTPDLPAEIRVALSAKQRGKIVSEETRARLREARSRQIPSEKALAALAAQRGKPHTEETKARMRKPGKPLSEDHRRKVAEAQRGRKHTAEHTEKIASALRGKKRPAGMMEKLAAARRGKPAPWVQGEKNSNSLLTESDVIAIRQAHRDGSTCADLGRQYGVHLSAIWLIVKRKNWKHVP